MPTARQPLRTLRGHRQARVVGSSFIRRHEISRAAGDVGDAVVIWDTANLQLLRTLSTQLSAVNALAFARQQASGRRRQRYPASRCGMPKPGSSCARFLDIPAVFVRWRFRRQPPVWPPATTIAPSAFGRQIEPPDPPVQISGLSMSRLPAIPVVDLRDGGPLRHARENAATGTRAARCLSRFSRVRLLPLVPLLDGISRRWLRNVRARPICRRLHA